MLLPAHCMSGCSWRLERKCSKPWYSKRIELQIPLNGLQFVGSNLIRKTFSCSRSFELPGADASQAEALSGHSERFGEPL